MKKSQLSIFILLGMVMLSVVSVAVYTSNSLAETKTQEQLELTLQAATAAGSFDEFVNKCLAGAMDDGMYLISKQGGKIYTSQAPGYPDLPQGHPFFDASQESVYEREIDSGIAISNGNQKIDRVYIPIVIKKKELSTDCSQDAVKAPPYYPEKDCAVRSVYYDYDYYTGSFPKLNPLCNVGKGPNKKDSEKGETCGVYYNNYGAEKTIQDQLTAYVQQYMEHNCFTDDDLKAIFSNINLTSKRPGVEIMIGDEDLIANISYPFELKIKNTIPVTKTMNYLYKYNSRIKKVHRWASSMLYDDPGEWLKLDYETERDAPLSSAYVSEASVKVFAHRPGDVNIAEITDPLSQVKGREMKFQFAIENRRPVLQRAGKPNNYGYDFVFYAGDEISIPVYAADPDEKDVQIGTETDPQTFRFVYIGWMQSYEDVFEQPAPQPAAAGAAAKPAPSGCDIKEKMKKFTEVKEMKMSAAADADKNSKKDKENKAEEKTNEVSREMEKCQKKKPITDKRWTEKKEKGKSRAEISYKTKPAVYTPGTNEQDVKDFGDVGLHYLEVYVYDQEGLYDFQNISILMLPRFAGQIDTVGTDLPGVGSDEMSLEDKYDLGPAASNRKVNFKIGNDYKAKDYALGEGTTIPRKNELGIEEIFGKHPLKGLFDALAGGPVSLTMELLKPGGTPNTIRVTLMQCIPYMSQNAEVVATYPYNTITVSSSSDASYLTRKVYKASGDPSYGEHACCYGDNDKGPRGTVKPESSICFNYRENTCLVNQYENNREPANYPDEKHYFASEASKGGEAWFPSSEASAGNKGTKENNYAQVLNLFKKPSGNSMWPASASEGKYGTDIALTMNLNSPLGNPSLDYPNLNDMFSREYTVKCGGDRGNICDGEKKDAFEKGQGCSNTQYCKYGESECLDWSYNAKDPKSDKVCAKTLVCVSGIGPDTKTAAKQGDGAYIVRFVADGNKGKSACDASAVNEPTQEIIKGHKVQVIQGPAYTYNDITNYGLLSVKDEIFIGVDCNYYDGKKYETGADKFSAKDVPKKSSAWVHYAVDSIGKLKEEQGLLGGPKPGVLAVDYNSCSVGAATIAPKCLPEAIDPDTPCDIGRGDNCFGDIEVNVNKNNQNKNNNKEYENQDENGEGYWCNSIFGANGCQGRSCWNLGFGNAVNKGDYIDYSPNVINKQSKNLCCGDDAGEFPKKCEGTDECSEEPMAACCNTQTSCVFEDKNSDQAECVASGEKRDFGNMQLMCLNGKWQDLDSSKISCENAGYKYSNGKGACCGDDYNEKWIYGGEVCCDGELNSGNVYCAQDKSWIIGGTSYSQGYVSMAISGSAIAGSSPKIDILGGGNPGLKYGGCDAEKVTACRNIADNRLEGVCAYNGISSTAVICYTGGQPASKAGYGSGKNQKNTALQKIINGCSAKNLACSVADLRMQSTASLSIAANGICNGVQCAACKIKDEKADCDNNFDADCDGLTGSSDSDCTGCQYNPSACGTNYNCVSNNCVLKSGCAYSNPVCGSDKNCVNNVCILKSGCSYNNPACGSDYACVNNACVLKSGCAYSNPSCGANYNCVNNVCVLKSGCQYNNPVCSANYECISNNCVLKSGCAYNNPSCDANYNCVNNACVLKSGCAYSNPACSSSQVCKNNACVLLPDLYVYGITTSSINSATKQATLRFRIGNSGAASPSGISWKADATDGASTKTNYGTYASSISANGITDYQYTIFTFANSGSHTVTVTLDYGGAIDETNEQNNGLSTTFTI